LQISIIANLQAKLEYRCIPATALSKLSSIAAKVAEIAGQTQLPSQPFVGANAFAHKGGIHVAAIRKVIPEL
jgi:2-isopropylmalate synthase